jgi:hypothetical protein
MSLKSENKVSLKGKKKIREERKDSDSAKG